MTQTNVKNINTIYICNSGISKTENKILELRTAD